MTQRNKTIVYILTGLCAGLTAFSIIEIMNISGFKSYLQLSLLQGAALGLIFGFTFGFTDAIVYKELKSGIFNAAVSAATGAIIAAASQITASRGMLFSANLLNMDYEKSIDLILPIWRGTGWMFMGISIGAIDGILKKTARRAVAGILGGLAGGLTGGLLYGFLTVYYPQNFAVRASGLAAMGILIGVFLGEFERRFSYGRLKVLNGKLKNREYLLIKKRTVVGPAMRSDIYIHGYKSIPKTVVEKDGYEIFFEPSETPALPENTEVTLLNDKPVSGKKYLKYQDVIQLGSLKLLYLPG